MAIFLAVSTLIQTGETFLTRVDVPASHNLPQGIHQVEAGKTFLGPFKSHLAAHYIWWLWAKRGVKHLTTELITAAERAAQEEDDLLWVIEQETLLAEDGMTPGERADLAAEYDPAMPEPIAVCWPFPSQAEVAR